MTEYELQESNGISYFHSLFTVLVDADHRHTAHMPCQCSGRPQAFGISLASLHMTRLCGQKQHPKPPQSSPEVFKALLVCLQRPRTCWATILDAENLCLCLFLE